MFLRLLILVGATAAVPLPQVIYTLQWSLILGDPEYSQYLGEQNCLILITFISSVESGTVHREAKPELGRASLCPSVQVLLQCEETRRGPHRQRPHLPHPHRQGPQWARPREDTAGEREPHPHKHHHIGPFQKSANTVTPVFNPNKVLEIAEEIQRINEAEVEAIEAIESSGDAEADEFINEIVDVIAEEIIAEELVEEIDDEMTNVAAEIVAEEIIEDLKSLDADLEIDVSDNEIFEGSGLASIDFGAITEVTI